MVRVRARVVGVRARLVRVRGKGWDRVRNGDKRGHGEGTRVRVRVRQGIEVRVGAPPQP